MDTDWAPKTVGVIGLGYVGQPITAAFANVGYDVIGMDRDRARVEDLAGEATGIPYEPGLRETLERCRNRIKFTTSYADVMAADAICITVGTPLGEDGHPDVSAIFAVASGISEYLRPGHLVTLRSTVTPGTTSRIAEKLAAESGLKLGEELFVGYCPERTIEGVALREIYSLPNIIGGVNAESTRRCVALMSRLGTRSVPVPSSEVAELCKLADNTYRSVNIALANEIGTICERAGVDAFDVVNAVNGSYERTNLFRPGLGADGPCLSKDPVILKEFAASLDFSTPLLDASREVNIASTHRVVKEVEAFAADRDLSDLRVAILGLAFKGQPETDDVRGSPAEYSYGQLLRHANERGETFGGFQFYDPVVELFHGVEVCRDVSECVSDANVILLLTDHPALRNLDGRQIAGLASRPLLIVDAWHNLARERMPVCDGVTIVRFGDGR